MKSITAALNGMEYAAQDLGVNGVATVICFDQEHPESYQAYLRLVGDILRQKDVNSQVGCTLVRKEKDRVSIVSFVGAQSEDNERIAEVGISQLHN